MFTTLGNSISRNGLVGEWLLDGNALDTSGNGNNGTATNVTYVKTSKGYQSQTGSFNGSNSSVNLGINKFPTLVNNCTLSAWVKNNSISTTQSIFSNGDTSSGGDIGWCFGIKLDGVNNTYTFRKLGIINENTGITPSVGKDDFICLTITSNVGRLYINSVLVWTGADSNAISNNTQKTKIGCHTSNSSNTQFYNGNIQGVRLYNIALSQDEIQTLYLEGLRKLGPTNIAKYPQLMEGLVAYYDMKRDATNIVDGVKATVNGATITTDRFGDSESAYSFQKVNGQDIRISTDFGSGYTMLNKTYSVIFKLNSLPSGSYPNNMYMILAHQLVSGGSRIFTRFFIERTGSIYRINLFGLGNYTFSPVIGQYYNITISRLPNGTNNIYLDGNLIGTNTGTDSASASGAINWFFLGGANLSGGTSIEQMNGVIDDVMVFNRALSADEVSTLYKLTSQDYIYPTPSYDLESLRDGLVLDLNEQGQDLSGNGNNGSTVNLAYPQWLRQGRAKGLSYNGNNAYINNIGINNITLGNSDKTIALWIKSGYTADRVMYVLGNSGTNTQLGLSLHTANEIKAYISGGPNILSGVIATKIHHIVLSKNGNEYKLYVDGVLRNTIIYADLNITGTQHQVGALGATYYWSGGIFNPRVRNRALSDNEIQALYYSQKGNFIY